MKENRSAGRIFWMVGGGLAFLALALLVSYLLAQQAPGAGRIGIVSIEGAIVDSKEALRQIERYQSDRAIRALVLRIDSPGGGAAAAQEIYEELHKTRMQWRKPVVASIGGLGASGAYYIACASDRIFANPGSITGSIGVIMQLANISQLLEKVGVRSVILKSGEHKDMGSLTKEMTLEEQRLFQEVLDDVHDQFVEAVAQGRKMDRGKVGGIADGRILTGRQAYRLGLVDELGGFPDAVRWAAKAAGMKGKPKVVEERKRRSFLLDLLGSRLFPFSSGGADGHWRTLSVQYLMR